MIVIHGEGIERYDSIIKAHSECYEQMLKHIAQLIDHVEAHGSKNPTANTLRAAVEHYRYTYNRLGVMLKEGK